MKYRNLSLPAVLHLSEINPPRSNKEKEEKYDCQRKENYLTAYCHVSVFKCLYWTSYSTIVHILRIYVRSLRDWLNFTF